MKNSVNNSNQSANSVQEVKLSQIVASTFNQRKFFDEQSLKELSENILQFGVLQPVLLRKVGKKFEIVYGERRFRAAKMASLSTIPANVRELSDEQALEISVIENLQRENIRPMEEAAGFIALLETKKYDYTALAKKIGKSEGYVRNRVKLNDLIHDIGQILDKEEINIGVALCVSTYPEEIQNDVYIKHLANKNYSWWGYLSTSEFGKMMENTYSLLLENYHFDKSQCVNCPNNTNTYNIFCDGIGKCTKRSCLIDKNSKYVISEAVRLANEENIQYVRVDHTNNIDDSIFGAFEKEGLMIPTGLSFAYCPKAPVQPDREDFANDHDYDVAMNEFRCDYEEYEADKADFDGQLADGSIAKCIYIKRNCVTVDYLMEKKREEESRYDHVHDDDTVSDEQENQRNPEKPVLAVDYSAQIRTLKKQDERNHEIAEEHILEDSKALMRHLPEYSGELSDLEIKMMYYFMLPSLSRDKERILIPDKDFATSNDKVKLIEHLTVENMTLIVREYIRVNFQQQAYRGSVIAEHFLSFVGQHCSEQLSEISQKYNEIYEKRKQRIDEQLAEMITPEPEEQMSPEYEVLTDILPVDISMLEVA